MSFSSWYDIQALEMPIPKQKLFQDKRRCCMLERDGTRKAFIVKRILHRGQKVLA